MPIRRPETQTTNIITKKSPYKVEFDKKNKKKRKEQGTLNEIYSKLEALKQK